MNFSIDDIKNSGCFDEIDIHIADFLSGISEDTSPLFYLLCLSLSNRLSRGDLCLFLDEIADKPPVYFFDDTGNDLPKKIIFPKLDEIINLLNKNKITGREGDYLPLVLDSKNRLYFHKYYSFENLLSEHIKTLADNRIILSEISDIQKTFSLLFPKIPEEIDWQSVAAYSALFGGITVVSGGPGTGKTSTVVKILALIAESRIKRGEGVSIALSAPTGKAAARLREAVGSALINLPIAPATKKLIPAETFTIHRLLGSIKDSHKFKRNKENPLIHDVVVVDECSMVDIALMLRLVQALKHGAQLILLGDKYQLSSVEGGAVFSDICGGAEGVSEGVYSKDFIDFGKKSFNINIPAGNSSGINKMNDALIMLNKSYRFGSKSGIGILAEFIKRGDVSGALEILEGNNYSDIKLIDTPSLNELRGIYRENVQAGIQVQDAPTEDKIFSLINNLTILTATKQGKFGADGMNQMAEDVLYRLGIIEPVEKFYHGRPVMVLRNDYALSLFNGDMGVVSDTGNVLFKEIEGNRREIHTSRLPEHVTAYAMTVHKSQGSEFNKALIVLPDKWNMVMTRELLYTAVTRARTEVMIAAGRDILKEMILTPTKRMSGLKDKLWLPVSEETN